jgi:hypothetical protein
MQIRSDQIETMGESNGRRFLDRLVELVSAGEESERSDPAVRQACRELMRKAGQYGFVSEFEMAAFVACGFEFVSDFDTRPDLPFRRILLEPDTVPRLKAAQMMALLEDSEKRSVVEGEPR